MNHSFWRGKRVFLSGHTGFKGSWLALWLQRLGAHVTGFALAPPTEPNLFTAARVADGMDSAIGDIRNLDQLAAALAHSNAEILFHMAAQPLVRASYANPVETYATNVMGTVNLLEAARRAGSLRAVVVVTSDKCYENREWLWGYRENEPMGGHDPYSSSKGCAELVTAAYRASFFPAESYSQHGVAIASARAGNVIGGGDWAADRLVPDIARAWAAGQTVTLRRPHSVRPWQHVLEPLGGYMLLAQHVYDHGPAFGEGWNFGPADSDALPVASVVEQLATAWGGDARWQVDGGNHPHEAQLLKLDCAKARTRLGWQPRLPLAEALGWTATWYQAFYNGSDARALTEAQIEQYQTRYVLPA